MARKKSQVAVPAVVRESKTFAAHGGALSPNERSLNFGARTAKSGAKMPGRERGKYLYRIARLIQEKTRELAILESMDGGRTIKEAAPGIASVPALRWRGRRCSRGTLSPELAVARQPQALLGARADVVVAHDAVSRPAVAADKKRGRDRRPSAGESVPGYNNPAALPRIAGVGGALKTKEPSSRS